MTCLASTCCCWRHRVSRPRPASPRFASFHHHISPVLAEDDHEGRRALWRDGGRWCGWLSRRRTLAAPRCRRACIWLRAARPRAILALELGAHRLRTCAPESTRVHAQSVQRVRACSRRSSCVGSQPRFRPTGRTSGRLLAISEFPKWRKYLISLCFRGKSSVRPVQVGGFDVNIVTHRRGGPVRYHAWPPPWEPSCRTRTGPLWKLTAPWTQNAPTAPWKTLCVFHKLPQGLSCQFTHEKPRKAPKWHWETRIDPDCSGSPNQTPQCSPRTSSRWRQYSMAEFRQSTCSTPDRMTPDSERRREELRRIGPRLEW